MSNNAALGYSLAAVENSSYQGIVTLLSETATSSLPASLTTSIPAAVSGGMHLWIRVWGHTASGTIAIAGTAPNSSAVVTSTTITLPVANLNDLPYADYITPEIYGAVNASGVTLGGGLTNGRVVIYGITAASNLTAASNRLLAGEVKFMDKRDDHPITQQRGDFAESHMAPKPMASKPEWEIQMDLQPDTGSLLIPMGINNSVTSAALPVGGTSLLGSTSVVTSGNVSASSQPTAPGMILQIVVGGGPATAATVTATGTNLDGETVTETVVPTTKVNGTWYSNTVFASIASNGIVYGSFGGAATITVTGFFGWQLTASMGSELVSSASLFQYDGTASKVMPFAVLQSWELAGAMSSELKLAMKGLGQLVGLVGDPTNAARQGPALVQSQDQAMTGWQAVAYLDDLSGTVGTTQQVDVLDYKIAVDLHQESKYTSQFIPPNTFYSRVYKNRHTLKAELTLDMTTATYNTLYFNAFKKGTRKQIQLWLRYGGPICTITGTPYYLGVKFNMNMMFVDDPNLDFQLSKPNVEIKLNGFLYKDDNLGYDLQAIWVSRRPSW